MRSAAAGGRLAPARRGGVAPAVVGRVPTASALVALRLSLRSGLGWLPAARLPKAAGGATGSGTLGGGGGCRLLAAAGAAGPRRGRGRPAAARRRR